jgi:hypothetical protein
VVLNTFVAMTGWVAGTQEHTAVDAGNSMPDHLFQARFPASIYEWLRTQWFEQRVPMTSVVIEAVTRAHSGATSLEHYLVSEGGEEATQRFTVRLPVGEYEWLRLESFQRRIPINRLLVAALEAYREQSAARSGIGDEAETGA